MMGNYSEETCFLRSSWRIFQGSMVVSMLTWWNHDLDDFGHPQISGNLTNKYYKCSTIYAWFWTIPNFLNETQSCCIVQHPLWSIKNLMLANQATPPWIWGPGDPTGTLRWKPWSRSWLRMATNTLISSRCGNSLDKLREKLLWNTKR